MQSIIIINIASIPLLLSAVTDSVQYDLCVLFDLNQMSRHFESTVFQLLFQSAALHS